MTVTNDNYNSRGKKKRNARNNDDDENVYFMMT